MKDYQIRSDFADEIISGSSEEEAYSHQTHEGEHVRVSHVCIHRADNVLGKQPGDYISIEFDSLHEHEAREEVIESLRAALCALMKDTVRRILVIGLGNRFITSDALGPQVARNILVTSHLYAQGHAHQLQGTRNVAVLAPGVMGQTGLESSSIIQSVSGVYHPDLHYRHSAGQGRGDPPACAQRGAPACAGDRHGRGDGDQHRRHPKRGAGIT